MPDLTFSGLGRAIAAGAFALAIGACSSDPRLYALAPVPGVAGPSAQPVVEVRTPVLAQWLDQDDIVRQSRDYRVHLARGDIWSGPLEGQLGQTLALDLAQRLPGTSVLAQNDAAATTPAAYVELTVTGFNEDQTGHAVLRGALSVHAVQGTIGPVLTTPLLLTGRAEGGSTASLVAELSALLGQVADQAAAQVRSLPVQKAAGAP